MKRIGKQRHLVLMESELSELELKANKDKNSSGVSLGKDIPSHTLNKSKSSTAFRLKCNSTIGMSTFSFQRPLIYPERRPEAGIVVNDTLALEEMKSKEVNPHHETDPIERKINLKIHKASNNKSTVSFFCKELQEEHRRLGMNPDEVLHREGVHPFYRFVPDHLEKDLTYEASLNFRKTISMVNHFYQTNLNQGEKTNLEEVKFRSRNQLLESTGYMSKHVGVGIKKNNFNLTAQNTKSEAFRSTFQDTKAYKLGNHGDKDLPDLKPQFMTTFHKTSSDDMRKNEAKLENDHRNKVGAKNFYAPPSEHLFREIPDNDVYGRPTFQVD
jgi:hypothetical protein